MGYGGSYRRKRQTEEDLEAEYEALVEEIGDSFRGKNSYGPQASK